MLSKKADPGHDTDHASQSWVSRETTTHFKLLSGRITLLVVSLIGLISESPVQRCKPSDKWLLILMSLQIEGGPCPCFIKPNITWK